MKNFEDYENFADFAVDANAGLSALLEKDNTVNHTLYGPGVITTVRATLSEQLDFYVGIEFASCGLKTFCYDFLITKGFISATDEIKSFMAEYKQICAEFWEAACAEKAAKFQAARLAAEAEAEAKKRAKKEEEITKRFNNELAKVRSMEKIDQFNNFFVALGWLAKHGKNLVAAMPDIIEPWFVSQFGDIKRTVVDSKKRTVNGFPMQWALSFALAVDDDTTMPAELFKYKSAQKNKIANTEFLYTLLSDYGFKTGVKTQDLEAIRATVPVSDLEAFDFGASM